MCETDNQDNKHTLIYLIKTEFYITFVTVWVTWAYHLLRCFEIQHFVVESLTVYDRVRCDHTTIIMIASSWKVRYEIMCRTSLNTQQTEVQRWCHQCSSCSASWLQPIRAAADRQVTRLWIQQLQKDTQMLRCELCISRWTLMDLQIWSWFQHLQHNSTNDDLS